MNEPVDILAIASQRHFYWQSMLNNVMSLHYCERTQQFYEAAWAQYSIAKDDLDAVQSLIRELARAE